jgi:hypothetical protein
VRPFPVPCITDDATLGFNTVENVIVSTSRSGRQKSVIFDFGFRAECYECFSLHSLCKVQQYYFQKERYEIISSLGTAENNDFSLYIFRWYATTEKHLSERPLFAVSRVGHPDRGRGGPAGGLQGPPGRTFRPGAVSGDHGAGAPPPQQDPGQSQDVSRCFIVLGLLWSEFWAFVEF